LRHHGVAHFLFHPAHIQKPQVAEALTGLVDYGRSQGLEWWTSAQIYQWEALRRGATAHVATQDQLTLSVSQPLREATLLFLASGTAPGQVQVNGQPVNAARRNLYGFEFDAVTTDLNGQVAVQLASSSLQRS
jgi:hypothetical protein